MTGYVEVAAPPESKVEVFWIETQNEDVTVGFKEPGCHFHLEDRPSFDPIGFIRDVISEETVIAVNYHRDGTNLGAQALRPDEQPDFVGFDGRGQVIYMRSWLGRYDAEYRGVDVRILGPQGGFRTASLAKALRRWTGEGYGEIRRAIVELFDGEPIEFTIPDNQREKLVAELDRISVRAEIDE